MLRTALLASAAAVAMSTAAQAADPPPYRVPPSVPQAAPTPLFTWTGFYVGLNAGYGTMDATSRYTGDPGFLAGVGSTVPGSYDISSDGFIGGAQLGFNWQFGQFVAGLEADIQYTDLTGVQSVTTTAPGFTVTGRSLAGLDWLGTLRGRIGFAMDRVLIYGTGGAAFGDVNVAGSVAGDPLFPISYAGHRSDIKTGWTLGGGVEWAWTNNLSLKLEYLYYDLGSVDFSLPSQNAFGAAVAGAQRTDIDGHIIRAGLNFRF